MLTPSRRGVYQISHCEKFDGGERSYGRSIGTVYIPVGSVPLCGALVKGLRLGALPTAALRLQSEGRVPAALPEEAAARDAQQGDRDGRAPRSQGRLAATFFIFFRQIAYRGLGTARRL